MNKSPLLTTPSQSTESMQSIQSMPNLPRTSTSDAKPSRTHLTSVCSVSSAGGVSVASADNILLYNEDATDTTDTDDVSTTSSPNVSPKKNTLKPSDAAKKSDADLINFSPTHNASGPVVKEAENDRRRCMSECLTSSTEKGSLSPLVAGASTLEVAEEEALIVNGETEGEKSESVLDGENEEQETGTDTEKTGEAETDGGTAAETEKETEEEKHPIFIARGSTENGDTETAPKTDEAKSTDNKPDLLAT